MASARFVPTALPENSPLTELQTLLDSVAELPIEQLPHLLGKLETIKAVVWLRMAAPSAVPATHDELLPVDAAAQRLATSKDYLYRHADVFPFTRRIGRSLKFSARGIDAYIQRNILTARQQKRNIGLAR